MEEEQHRVWKRHSESAWLPRGAAGEAGGGAMAGAEGPLRSALRCAAPGRLRRSLCCGLGCRRSPEQPQSPSELPAWLGQNACSPDIIPSRFGAGLVLGYSNGCLYGLFSSSPSGTQLWGKAEEGGPSDCTWSLAQQHASHAHWAPTSALSLVRIAALRHRLLLYWGTVLDACLPSGSQWMTEQCHSQKMQPGLVLRSDTELLNYRDQSGGKSEFHTIGSSIYWPGWRAAWWWMSRLKTETSSHESWNDKTAPKAKWSGKNKNKNKLFKERDFFADQKKFRLFIRQS